MGSRVEAGQRRGAEKTCESFVTKRDRSLSESTRLVASAPLPHPTGPPRPVTSKPLERPSRSSSAISRSAPPHEGRREAGSGSFTAFPWLGA